MSNYLGISPPRTRELAATLRATGQDAESLALDMGRLLDQAQLASSGPALAADVARTMAAAASVLEQRATIADLCRTDPGVLGANLAASQEALWGLLVDDQGVNLLSVDVAEPTASGSGTDVIDRLWDLLGTGATMNSLNDELKMAARMGIVFRLQMAVGAHQLPRLLEYLGPLAQTPPGRRLLAYLSGSEAGAAVIAHEASSLSSRLATLSQREAVTEVGRWFETTFPRLSGATKGVGRASDVFFVGIESIEVLDALVDTRWSDAAYHSLWAGAGVLLLTTNPIAVGVGAVLLTGLLVYENRDWIKRNLSPTGLAHIGQEILDGVDSGLRRAVSVLP